MADDVGRAFVIPANVSENFLDPPNIGWVGFEIERSGLGIALDGSQRLVQFMRHRGRKCASHRRPVQMDDFQQSLPQIRFCRTAATAFEI